MSKGDGGPVILESVENLSEIVAKKPIEPTLSLRLGSVVKKVIRRKLCGSVSKHFLMKLF